MSGMPLVGADAKAEFDLGHLLDMGMNTEGAQAVIEQNFVLPSDFAWDWIKSA